MTQTPALTESEWTNALNGTQDAKAGLGVLIQILEDGHQRPHALAALCLYQQPFGFTHVDLVMLRLLAANARKQGSDTYWEGQARDLVAERLESLAAKIRALLPPDEPS